jgi:hypothetical protein
LEEERLTSGKFDIIQKSESTYERFLYAHYPEQASIITIFVKVNFKSEKNPSSLKALIKKVAWAFKKYMIGNDENDKYSSSLKSFIEKVDWAFKKYGLSSHNESVNVQTNSNSSPLFIGSTVVILIISSLFIWLKLNRHGKKEKICQNKQKEIVSSSYKSISTDYSDDITSDTGS